MQGAQKGDLLILYLKDSERKYVLAADSSGETIDDLFKGIERYNPPKKRARSRHGGRRYYCEVEMETGERFTLPVSGGEYALISPEDSVLVYRGGGALGIDYAYYAGRAVQEDE